MLRSRLCVLAAVMAVVAAGWAPLPKGKTKADLAKEELKRLQGTWEVVSVTWGKLTIRAKMGEVTYAVKGDSLLCSDKALGRCSLRLDPSKSPRVMDLNYEDGALVRGVYRLEGDTLTRAYYLDHKGAGRRPADFKPAEGVVVEVYKRVRPKAKKP